uniref:ShKT domain-containing protein n=1 Tax=Parastrongyloides trichosuri TaxID=131310 RepID=A0A0N4ZP35_PARTI
MFIIIILAYLIQFVHSDANCDRDMSYLTTGDCLGVEFPDDSVTPTVAADYLSCYWNGPWLCRAADQDGDGDTEVLCCSNNIDGDEALSEVNYLYHNYVDNTAFTTTITPCVDIDNRCAEMSYLCRETQYYDYFRINCRLTCGICGGGTVPALCRDSTTVSCKQQAEFCQNKLYYDFLTASCPVTCRRCGPPYTWVNSTIETETNVEISPPLCTDSKPHCHELRMSCQGPKGFMVSRMCPKTCGNCF